MTINFIIYPEFCSYWCWAKVVYRMKFVIWLIDGAVSLLIITFIFNLSDCFFPNSFPNQYGLCYSENDYLILQNLCTLSLM